MRRKSREEAAGLLADGSNHDEYSPSYSEDSSSHSDDGNRISYPFDEESAHNPSSPAYPAFKSGLTFGRSFFSAGGPARRRLILSITSLVILSLLFWGFGAHEVLLKEKEQFVNGDHSESGGVNTGIVVLPTSTPTHSINEAVAQRPPDATPTRGLWDEEEEKFLQATETPNVEPSPIPQAQESSESDGSASGSNSHNTVDGHPGHLGTSGGKPKPKPVFDEYGHNAPHSNTSDYCTTWPVDGRGKYTPKTFHNDERYVPTSYGPEEGWKKPTGFPIIGLVFYGRKRNVDILDCYLQQNLASNGGYLDEVRFMVKTTNEDDTEWLQEFVKGTPEYIYQDLGNCTTQQGYGCIWEFATEPDTMYIKIDDDILYIHPDAIPQIVHTRLAVPEAFAVSAQLVNSPVVALQQYHYGAIHPFIPDPEGHPTRPATEEWRPSKSGLVPKGSEAYKKGATMDVDTPYLGHPWLLLSDSPANTLPLIRTPMGDWQSHLADDPAFGPGWSKWGNAAQQEYSLLYNIELDQLDRYHFGRPLRYTTSNPDFDPSTTKLSALSPFEKESLTPAERAALRPSLPTNPEPHLGGEQLFDTQYQRSNLNFVAIWGHDIRLTLPIGDDENDFTKEVPRKLGRPFLIDTRAVVAHHSFFTQHGGIRTTDLMDRWRALANEGFCRDGRGKVPWDKRCKGF